MQCGRHGLLAILALAAFAAPSVQGQPPGQPAQAYVLQRKYIVGSTWTLICEKNADGHSGRPATDASRTTQRDPAAYDAGAHERCEFGIAVAAGKDPEQKHVDVILRRYACRKYVKTDGGLRTFGEVDTDRPPRPEDRKPGSIYRRAAKNRFRVVVDASGKVVRWDWAGPGLQPGTSARTPKPKKPFIDPGALLRETAAYLPSRPVQVGDTWESVREPDLALSGAPVAKERVQCTLAGVERRSSGRVATIEATGTAMHKAEPRWRTQVTVKLQFNIDKGFPIHRRVEWQSVLPADPGQPGSHRADLRSTFIQEMREKRPVGSRPSPRGKRKGSAPPSARRALPEPGSPMAPEPGGMPGRRPD